MKRNETNYALWRKIGGKIREIREEKGWDLQVLSSKVGISWLTIKQIEGANRPTTVVNLYRIASAFGMPVYFLLPAEMEET